MSSPHFATISNNQVFESIPTLHESALRLIRQLLAASRLCIFFEHGFIDQFSSFPTAFLMASSEKPAFSSFSLNALIKLDLNLILSVRIDQKYLLSSKFPDPNEGFAHTNQLVL
jgi:hypothetical protein